MPNRARTSALLCSVMVGAAVLTMLGPSHVPLQGAALAAAPPDPRPNIVLITTDDQRVDDISAMPKVRTLLAKRGTTFAKSYSSFPLCCPARASILTGQYAHNHGVLGNGSTTSPLGGYQALDTRSTIATWLSDAGYQTAFVGKFLNGYGETSLAAPPGWDEWHALLTDGDYFDYLDVRLSEDGELRPYPGRYQSDLLSDISTDVIERRVAGDAPLFLWASYAAPHAGGPVEPDDPALETPAPAARHRDTFASQPLPASPAFNEADVSDKPTPVRNRRPISALMRAQIRESHRQRLESLQAVDEAVDRTVRALDAAGELANTVIMFTSDNGYMLGEHRIVSGKRFAYEPSARVPLIARGPGFPSGRTRGQIVANIDLAPTFADIADVTPGLVVDGRSLLPLATAPAQGTGRDLVLEAGPRTLEGPMFYTALRTGRWLYVEYHETTEVELYDMAVDPHQLRSLAANPAYASRRTSLAARLARARDCAGASCR